MEYMTQDSRLKNLKVYEANKVWLQSSNMDRTIASSMSLAEGIWPETADESMYPNNISKQIPVHSVGSGKNDVTIRSYANCPTFHTRLEKLYSSKSFVKKEKTIGLFESIENKISEPNWWSKFWQQIGLCAVEKCVEYF